MGQNEKSRKYTFLVIDDDPGDVEILRRRLREIPDWEIELLAATSWEVCRKELEGLS